jgi:hypothetical protein
LYIRIWYIRIRNIIEEVADMGDKSPKKKEKKKKKAEKKIAAAPATAK